MFASLALRLRDKRATETRASSFKNPDDLLFRKAVILHALVLVWARTSFKSGGSRSSREPFEEAVALGEPPETGDRARREQPEVACVFPNLLPRTPIDQGIEAVHCEASQKDSFSRWALAVYTTS